MTLAPELFSRVGREADLHRCTSIRDILTQDGLFNNVPELRKGEAGDQGTLNQWRIPPAPVFLPPAEVEFLCGLGRHLLAFYRALNRLYLQSVRGTQPAWVAGYLDQGKPESLISYSRMKRFRDLLPGVIRPDVIPTDDGLVITELDSVPGGIGLTGALASAYGTSSTHAGRSEVHTAPSHHGLNLGPQPWDIVGGTDGILRGFAAMLRANMGDRSGCVAIVVSEEARDYRPEMRWLAAQLRERKLETWCVDPRDVRFTEEGLLVSTEAGERPVAVVYRFFELFDLLNVPKAELIMYSAKKEHTIVTPPFKPALEEKLAFALLHHPILATFWQQELGPDTFNLLSRLIPKTWILDPRPVPPSAIIPGLQVTGKAVADWRDLAHLSQKERRLVIKPSGFSELAWGSRGVSIGHDLSQTEWAAALETALTFYPTTPYVLQEFHKGRQFDLSYYDPVKGDLIPMSGRARLCPYYFVTEDRADLAGILVTVCPLDKKLIHGMRDAVMAPGAIAAGPQ